MVTTNTEIWPSVRLEGSSFPQAHYQWFRRRLCHYVQWVLPPFLLILLPVRILQIHLPLPRSCNNFFASWTADMLRLREVKKLRSMIEFTQKLKTIIPNPAGLCLVPSRVNNLHLMKTPLLVQNHVDKIKATAISQRELILTCHTFS